MPHSLVLNLIPQGNIPTKFLTGRHHHALFLDLVKSIDPELATLLHGQTSDKAFSLSVLQTPTRQQNLLQWQHDRSIPTGTPCWWRISLLDDSLFSKLAYLWLSIDPHQPWHIGQVGLQMVSVISTPQSDRDWASFSTYQQLHETHQPQSERFTLASTLQPLFESANTIVRCQLQKLFSTVYSNAGISIAISLFRRRRSNIFTPVLLTSIVKLRSIVGAN